MINKQFAATLLLYLLIHSATTNTVTEKSLITTISIWNYVLFLLIITYTIFCLFIDYLFVLCKRNCCFLNKSIVNIAYFMYVVSIEREREIVCIMHVCLCFFVCVCESFGCLKTFFMTINVSRVLIQAVPTQGRKKSHICTFNLNF